MRNMFGGGWEAPSHGGAQAGFIAQGVRLVQAPQPSFGMATVSRSQAFGMGSAAFSGQPGSQVQYGQSPAQPQAHPELGQTISVSQQQKWYDRAKAAARRYETLIEALGTVGSQIEIDSITAWLNDGEGPAYRYAGVTSDLKDDVENPLRYREPNISAYNIKRRRDRVEELEEWNGEFQERVNAALESAGKRRIETRTEFVTSDLTVPIAIAGGAVVLALLLA